MSYLSVKRLYDELDYWIHIGIGDDIYKIPHHRPEYQHLVKKWSLKAPENAKIPSLVLSDLQKELKLPFFLRPTFYRLLWLSLSRKITRL